MLPSYNYAYAKARVIGALLKLENCSVFAEMSLTLNSRVYTPDVCVYAKRDVDLSLSEPTEINDMPMLVVEVLSHTVTLQEILDKFDIYFDSLVKSCWLVVPVAGTVIVYASPEQSQRFRTGDIVDEQLNLTLPLLEIFDDD